MSAKRNIANLITSFGLGGLIFAAGSALSGGITSLPLALLASSGICLASGIGLYYGNKLFTNTNDDNLVKSAVQERMIEKLQERGLNPEQAQDVIRGYDIALTETPRYGFWQNIRNIGTTFLGYLAATVPAALGGVFLGEALAKRGHKLPGHDKIADVMVEKGVEKIGGIIEAISSEEPKHPKHGNLFNEDSLLEEKKSIRKSAYPSMAIGGVALAVPAGILGACFGNRFFSGASKSYINREADYHLQQLMAQKPELMAADRKLAGGVDQPAPSIQK